jgi:Uma2 family endonuclease
VTASTPYRVDPDDPRAPPLEVWLQLSPAERARIIAELPSEVNLGPPEGDAHRVPKQRALEALEAFFKRAGRKVYFSSELPVYYPGERMFAPDLIAVLAVEPHERASWVVAQEGRGLDFALEVTLSGSRRKDLEENVVRFAALGIPEYFVFDRPKRRILGYRLPQPGSAYDPILPRQGRWGSNVLGLELGIEESRFRFYVGSAVVPRRASSSLGPISSLTSFRTRLRSSRVCFSKPMSAPSSLNVAHESWKRSSNSCAVSGAILEAGAGNVRLLSGRCPLPTCSTDRQAVQVMTPRGRASLRQKI